MAQLRTAERAEKGADACPGAENAEDLDPSSRPGRDFEWNDLRTHGLPEVVPLLVPLVADGLSRSSPVFCAARASGRFCAFCGPQSRRLSFRPPTLT